MLDIIPSQFRTQMIDKPRSSKTVPSSDLSLSIPHTNFLSDTVRFSQISVLVDFLSGKPVWNKSMWSHQIEYLSGTEVLSRFFLFSSYRLDAIAATFNRFLWTTTVPRSAPNETCYTETAPEIRDAFSACIVLIIPAHAQPM